MAHGSSRSFRATLPIVVILFGALFGVAEHTSPSGAALHACRPLSNAGHCYEPGEFCRHSDRGVRGLAGDGKRIICRNNDGLRWEPY